MRKIILSATVAVTAALSFAAPSQAGGYGSGYGHHNHHVRVYDDYQPTCFIKKIKTWDYYGKLHIKKVKVCR